MDELTQRHKDILAFERQWWKYQGAKETAISEQFGLSGTRYTQLLIALIDQPVAHAFDPLLVKRLQRQRVARRRERSAARLGVR